MTRVILIHGNGGGTPDDNWIPYLKKEIEKLGVKVDAPQFPDAVLARASYWLPFLKNELKADKNTIIVGHSSGAIAAMKYAETNQLLGTVLVGSYHTDLGIETEKISGYFDTSWDWNAIKKNQKWIIQFADLKDPWIPIEEARYVRDKLNTEYHESDGHGHFGGDHLVNITQEPLTDQLKKQIYSGFSLHAVEQTGHDEKFDPIALIARNEEGQFMGAIVAELFWGALHIKYLYIDEQFRGRKVGQKLIEETFDYGKEHQCPFAFVETMCFQALGFYQKMGFKLEYTRSGYAHGTSFHYLRKDLI